MPRLISSSSVARSSSPATAAVSRLFRKFSFYYSILATTGSNPTRTTTSGFSPIASNTRRNPSFSKTAMAMSSSTPAMKTRKLSPRILDTLDPCVVLMKEMIGEYAPLWEDKGGIFSLAQGVVYWEPPESCQQALVDELTTTTKGNSLHTYGPAQGIPELTDALQEKIRRENGLMNHNVMVTVGANQAYMNVVLTIMGSTSRAVVFAPYYFNHVMALQMCCGKHSVIVGPTNDDGIPDVKWLEETLRQEGSIDMVTIVNPGNPTGVSLSKKDHLQPIVDLCEQYGCWLVLDCTYEYFTTPANHQPIATFGDSPNVIHIFSFSKSYSLAGYRCGYLVLPNKQKEKEEKETDDDSCSIWNQIVKVQDTLPIAPPRISQIAALGALRSSSSSTDWVQTKYATLDASRDCIMDALKPLKTMGGTGAMYIMAQLPPQQQGSTSTDDYDVHVCRQLVKEYGIAIIPGSFCGFPGWIRVCYANLEPSKCQQAAERLQTGLQTIFKL